MNTDESGQEKTRIKQQQKQALENASVTYEWQLIYNSYGPAVWPVAIFGSSVPIGIWIATGGLEENTKWILVSFIILLSICRYLVLADKDATFKITPLGIIHTEKDCVPDIAYTIMRGIAWLGVALCIFAVFYVGPMAFVGAGASALMAFKFTGFHAVTSEWHEVFLDDYNLEIEFKDRMHLESTPFDSEDDLFLWFQTLYFKPSQKIEIINALSKHINIVKVTEKKKDFDLGTYLSRDAV